ncbi:hypothetical protein, partial [Segatella sp.]|uniref:hypothetical protein n=1 Tax=Segatella sp. TaxID=2974253 RepID=UPI003AB88406
MDRPTARLHWNLCGQRPQHRPMGHPPIIVAIDQKGVPVAPFIISETYTVEENTAALAEVSIDSYAWY